MTVDHDRNRDRRARALPAPPYPFPRITSPADIERLLGPFDAPTADGLDPVALRIGGEIRRWRRLRGHSIVGLARVLGVSHSTVSRWESGHRRPTIPHLIALGRVFGAGARTLIPE